MAWSDPDPVGERGFETTYSGRGFRARLVFDCHHEPRKLEVSLEGDTISAALIEHLKPFAPPRVISPEQLVLFDRTGYFRLLLIPGRLQALLRKDAPLSVIAELITQLARAHGEDAVPALRASDCPLGAIGIEEKGSDGGAAGRLRIDEPRCTRCLDCVRPYASGGLLPSAEGPAGDAPAERTE
jgi:hypothetical protein